MNNNDTCNFKLFEIYFLVYLLFIYLDLDWYKQGKNKFMNWFFLHHNVRFSWIPFKNGPVRYVWGECAGGLKCSLAAASGPGLGVVCSLDWPYSLLFSASLPFLLLESLSWAYIQEMRMKMYRWESIEDEWILQREDWNRKNAIWQKWGSKGQLWPWGCFLSMNVKNVCWVCRDGPWCVVHMSISREIYLVRE